MRVEGAAEEQFVGHQGFWLDRGVRRSLIRL